MGMANADKQKPKQGQSAGRCRRANLRRGAGQAALLLQALALEPGGLVFFVGVGEGQVEASHVGGAAVTSDVPGDHAIAALVVEAVQRELFRPFCRSLAFVVDVHQHTGSHRVVVVDLWRREHRRSIRQAASAVGAEGALEQHHGADHRCGVVDGIRGRERPADFFSGVGVVRLQGQHIAFLQSEGADDAGAHRAVFAGVAVEGDIGRAAVVDHGHDAPSVVKTAVDDENEDGILRDDLAVTWRDQLRATWAFVDGGGRSGRQQQANDDKQNGNGVRHQTALKGSAAGIAGLHQKGTLWLRNLPPHLQNNAGSMQCRRQVDAHLFVCGLGSTQVQRLLLESYAESVAFYRELVDDEGRNAFRLQLEEALANSNRVKAEANQ